MTPLSLRGTAQHLPVHGQLHVSAVCVSEGERCARLVWLRLRAITFAVARAVTLQLSTRKSARGRPRALVVADRVSYSSLDLERRRMFPFARAIFCLTSVFHNIVLLQLSVTAQRVKQRTPTLFIYSIASH